MLVAAPAAEAQLGIEFLRGDMNVDGQVTGSDAHFLLSHLFRGGPRPQCTRAGDANADGSLNITDSIFILNFLTLGGPAPCQPFPDPGTFNDLGIACDSYNIEGPIDDDPVAELRVSNAIASPAGTTSLNVFASSSTDLGGYFGHIVMDGARFGSVSEAVDLSETLATGFLNAQVFGGRIRVGFLSSIVNTNHISAGENMPVLRLSVCLENGTKAGDYTTVFENAELTDFESGKAIIPATPAGTIAVPEDVSNSCESPGEPPIESAPDCPDDPGPPDPPELPDPSIKFDFVRGDMNRDGRLSLSDAIIVRNFLFVQDSPIPPCLDASDANDDAEIGVEDIVFLLDHIFLGGAAPAAPYPDPGQDPTDDDFGCHTEEILPPDAERVDEIGFEDTFGVPGRDVNVPITLTNAEAIDGFQLFASFDPAKFTPSGLSFDRGFFSNRRDDLNGVEFTSIVEGLDDVVSIVLIPSLTSSRLEVRPSENGRHVFSLRGQLAENLVPGEEVRLEFTDGEGGAGFGSFGLVNELVSEGFTRFPVLGSGVVTISEGGLFIRGDSDADGSLNLTDPINTLAFLFLGGPPPGCSDAADANDDGRLEITDPIMILNLLFLGGRDPAPPFPDAGVDPTDDDLPDC